MACETDRWGTTDFTVSKSINWEEYNNNPCRSLIEVPGGTDWKIRYLCEAYPQYCWKFIDGKIIAHYYLEQASKILHGTGSEKQYTSIPKFYATLPYFSSPFEISVQPKFLDRVRQKLDCSLLQFYSSSSVRFQEEELFDKVPCAVKENDKWFRAKIVSINKMRTSAVVLLVDYGVEKIAFLSEVRPLFRQFGRIPPLALKCRVKDVFINDLDSAKVEYFKSLIASLNNVLRVEIVSNEEPFLVNLFHPTIADKNIGIKFHRPLDHAVREEAKQRRWSEHKRRQLCENDSDFDDDDSEEISDEEKEFYVQKLGRSPKFPINVTSIMSVAHIENSTMIFLRSEWMETKLKIITKSLSKEWNTLSCFQSDHLSPETACAVSFNSQIYRAIVESKDGGKFNLFLPDYGKCICAPFTALRALPYREPFIDDPMVYVVSLERDYTYFPHPSETIHLKQLLPINSTITFNAMRTRTRVPVIGILERISGENIDTLLQQILRSKRINLHSRDLVPYTGQNMGSVDNNFVHRLRCNHTLAKGKLTQCILSELY